MHFARQGIFFMQERENLHQVSNQGLTIAGKIVDDGNFDHRVSARLLLHGSAGHIHQHLGVSAGLLIFMLNSKSWLCVLPETPLRVKFTP